MKYYRFYPDCHYVPGLVRGTLYNVTDGEIRHLTKKEADIVNMLMGSNSIDAVVDIYGSEAQSLIERYVEEGFGALYSTPIFSEEYRPHTRFSVRGLFESPPVIKVVCIQITDACTGKCEFCGEDSFYNLEACNSCLRWPCGGGNELLKNENLAKTIESLLAINVPAVIYSGGNPLMEFDALTATSRQFKKGNPNIRLLVNTNGDRLNDAVAKAAKEIGLTFNFTLFGTNSDDYAKVTRNAELYAQLLKAIELCKQYEIAYDIVPLVSNTMRDKYCEMRKVGHTCGGKGMHSTELLPKGVDGVKKVTGPTGKNRIEKINMQVYYHNKVRSFCLNGTISVASNGSLLSCPMWPESIGNIIADGDLSKVFGSAGIHKYWDMNSDKMPICRECENRYACVDCALLAWQSNKDPIAHKIFCDYVPESGRWEDEGVSENEKG